MKAQYKGVWTAAALVGLAVLLTLPMGARSVEADEPEVESTSQFSPLSGNLESGTIEGTSPFKSLDTAFTNFFLCSFTTGADNPHLSSTGFATSAHGWWVAHSPSCPTYADVEVRLWGYYCGSAGVGPEFCFWKFLTSDEKRVKSGGGSGRRTTARNDCTQIQLVGYRSVVDVNLVGQIDGYDQETRYANVLCYPDN